MKPHVLQVTPIRVDGFNETMQARYTVHRLFEQHDPEGYVAANGQLFEGVVTGGQAGIRRSWLEQMPKLQIVAVNGASVASDARSRSVFRHSGVPSPTPTCRLGRTFRGRSNLTCSPWRREATH